MAVALQYDPLIMEPGNRSAPIWSQLANLVTSDPLKQGPRAKQGVSVIPGVDNYV